MRASSGPPNRLRQFLVMTKPYVINIYVIEGTVISLVKKIYAGKVLVYYDLSDSAKGVVRIIFSTVGRIKVILISPE